MSEARVDRDASAWPQPVQDSDAPAAPVAVARQMAARSKRAHCLTAARAAGSEAAAPRPASPLPHDSELWDVHAAARFLKRSVSWVYHRAEDGTLPVKRLAGWGVRFIPSELRAWVEEGGGPRRR
jgi:predicted DNA-binding transcriptional regulator AlpA